MLNKMALKQLKKTEVSSSSGWFSDSRSPDLIMLILAYLIQNLRPMWPAQNDIIEPDRIDNSNTEGSQHTGDNS